jgi:hypothetical protein
MPRLLWDKCSYAELAILPQTTFNNRSNWLEVRKGERG